MENSWRTCRHCGMKKYCSEKTMIEHEEDCPQRPSQKKKMLICPKCESVLSKIGSTYICVGEHCTYELDVLPGGKL